MITIILAHIFGLTFMVLGLSMFLNKKWTASVVEEISKSQGLIWLAGLLTVFMGAFIISFNYIWTSGLPLFVTILGWLTFIKGAVILIFPHFTISYYTKMNRDNIFVWGGVIVFILGLLLLL